MKRLEKMKRQLNRQNELKALGHGSYMEISEPEFLDCVLKSPRCVVHFYHGDFVRCRVVDDKLSALAPAAVGCRFVKVNSEKCPFFVEKLNVRVLPTLVYFVDGKAVHRVTGFTELGGSDNFRIIELIKNLNKFKLLKGSDENEIETLSRSDGTIHAEDDDDSEYYHSD
jgi:thioredoxin-like negative regulator of GroEL